MRFSVVPVLGLVLAMGCDNTSPVAPGEGGPELDKQTILHINEKNSGTFELRGFEGCFGELVVATGTVRFRQHTATSTITGNENHTKLTFYLDGTAVGQRTGRVWKYKDSSSLQFNTPNLTAPQGNFSTKVVARLISQGKQPNAVLKLRLHVVINGQGVQKVVIDSEKGPCRAV